MAVKTVKFKVMMRKTVRIEKMVEKSKVLAKFVIKWFWGFRN